MSDRLFDGCRTCLVIHSVGVGLGIALGVFAVLKVVT